MANMTWERIKERNGRTDAIVPDLKVNDCFLFEGEDKETVQWNVVTDIYHPSPDSKNIIIQYMPEHTPVCNEGAFHYGTKKFFIKETK